MYYIFPKNQIFSFPLKYLQSVQDMATSLKTQTTHLQQELQGTVKAEQFASVCGELQATLAREQQTQKLLAHQANRLQNLTQVGR